MNNIATLSFSIQPFEGTRSITPYVNGKSLVKAVAAFEHEREFDPAGGYGGLIPEWFDYGPLNKYFLGDFEPDSYFMNLDGIYLLGCDCGEVGCWPLVAQVRAAGKTVEWTSFRQTFRKERDYSDFGPFVFDADQYRKAVAALCNDFSPLVGVAPDQLSPPRFGNFSGSA
jgi:hypothetical protein